MLGYDVVEVTDYGVPRREQWDAIDRIGEFAQQVKQAINQANKTDLVELDLPHAGPAHRSVGS